MMQERRKRKIKRGSYTVLQREARRQERLKWLFAVARTNPESSVICENKSRRRVIIDLACKTVVLLQRNTLIQQKIIDLQKETTAFMSAVLSSPANKEVLTATQYLDTGKVIKIAHPECDSSIDKPDSDYKKQTEV